MKIFIQTPQHAVLHPCTPNIVKTAGEDIKYKLHGRYYIVTINKKNEDRIKLTRVYDGCLSKALRPAKAISDFISRACNKHESCFKTRADQLTEILNKRNQTNQINYYLNTNNITFTPSMSSLSSRLLHSTSSVSSFDLNHHNHQQVQETTLYRFKVKLKSATAEPLLSSQSLPLIKVSSKSSLIDEGKGSSLLNSSLNSYNNYGSCYDNT